MSKISVIISTLIIIGALYVGLHCNQTSFVDSTTSIQDTNIVTIDEDLFNRTMIVHRKPLCQTSSFRHLGRHYGFK